MKVNLTINGVKIQAEAGQTILQVAQEAGIHIPILCHHPALPPEGACRICLVEIERQRSLQPACTFPATEGLVVHTHSEKVVEARKFVLEMLLSDHPFDCMTCDATGNCLLQDLVYEYGVRTEPYPGLAPQFPGGPVEPVHRRWTATSASCAGAACGRAATSTGWTPSAWSTAASTPASPSGQIRRCRTARASSAGAALRSARRRRSIPRCRWARADPGR